MFRNNIANDGKGGAIYTINNDVYLSDVIFDNNQAYTSTSYSDGDGGVRNVRVGHVCLIAAWLAEWLLGVGHNLLNFSISAEVLVGSEKLG